MNTINNINFFFLIDKPLGITSFDVIRDLRKKTNIKKIGHTGTLDPLATGLLLVAFGSYTKLIPYFEKDIKSYDFEISLTGTTESLDVEKELIPANEVIFSETEKSLDISKIQEILEKNFTGEIEQIPPKYSALKIDGKKALELVREGKEFEMKKRKATIHSIELVSFDFPKISFRTSVSAGTYIRTIAGDFGDIIGTGAHVTELRRTSVGNLGLEGAQILDNFSINNYLDIKKLFPENQYIKLSEEIITRLNHGQRVRNDLGISPGEYFLQENGIITHVIEIDEYLLRMKRKIT